MKNQLCPFCYQTTNFIPEGSYIDIRCEHCSFSLSDTKHIHYYKFVSYLSATDLNKTLKVLLRYNKKTSFIELDYTSNIIERPFIKTTNNKYIVTLHYIKNNEYVVDTLCEVPTTTPSVNEALELMAKVEKLKLFS